MRGGRIMVQDLSKRFGPVLAVQDLSFTVEPGTVTGFIGPNGSGKTTTLRALLGLVIPSGGRAMINDVPFAELADPARVVGAVLEAQGFHPARSAADHLRCYAAAIGIPDTRAHHVLELTGLTGAAHRPVRGYSLGMRQRLALGTALLGDPSVLVLDEPGNGLDPEGIAWLRGFMRNFARSGGTVLVSSHLLTEIEQTVDEVVIISFGRRVYHGTLDELRRTQRNQVLVACSDAAALAGALAGQGIAEIDALPDGRIAVSDADPVRVGDIALAARVAIYGMVEHKPDLEQVFLRLTAGPYAPPPWVLPQPGAR